MTDMGLLDDDDVPPFVPSGLGKTRKPNYDNFEQLQNMGHEKNSDDFSDSPFADRKDEPIKDE